MVIFFVTDKLPAALVSMLGGSVLVVCGIIEPAKLFSAFSGSTIVLVAAMMVVGSALFHTGIAAKMADVLVKVTGHTENGIMIAFMLVSTIISAICSGVAVVAMLLPIVISVSKRAGVSVSRQLIPMSFAASFGCNLTLMGAASNVVVNGALQDLGVSTMSFFELGKVGIPISIAGILFFLTIGKRFLTPGDTADQEYLEEYTGSNKAVEFNKVKAGLCLVILAILLVVMAAGIDWLPMYLVAAFGAFILVLTGCIKQNDAYKSIDLSTLFIVAGMSAVSAGMSSSGAGTLIADTAVKLLGEHPNKMVVLFIILVLVTLLTNAMMNTSTALLVTPLFIPVVQAFGMNTTAVAVAICVAASSPFLSPVGSGTNTLIIRPGNLKFMDFFRPGLSLSVVVLIVSMIFIPLFWPL
jgi:anion transporter